MIDKGVCDKGYIWNPSNCECEGNKSCDFGEYLDYENCKCRKTLVDKLVEECRENVDWAKWTEIALAENVHAIYLAVNYRIPIFIPFRQTGGNKKPNNTWLTYTIRL